MLWILISGAVVYLVLLCVLPTLTGRPFLDGGIGVALGLYMVEGIAIELTSLGVICTLLLLYYIFPVLGPTGPQSGCRRQTT